MATIAVFLPAYLGETCVAADQANVDFFETRIRPVLVEHCYRCHSADSGKSKGGLQIDTRGGWSVGGDSGPAIVPGKPEESLVYLAISRSGETSEMPPTKHLPDSVVNDFKKWIEDGATDPRNTNPREGKHQSATKEAIDIEAGRQFWSFQPLKTFSANRSIDDFVQPKSPTASANRLVRRLFLDLIGLPPTSDERREFLRLYREQSPDVAVSVFADRLLARNEFGEKWARHWLDVARYADSNGGDFNLTFPESWRYRNYVIDAFNHDMPYDQFLVEQIAGDLMPYKSVQQRNRQLIATGFLMVAPKMLTERDKPKMHLDIADEQVDTIGRAIMGLTLGCARCHDHKFDPIPTADYYAIAGILHSTRTVDGILMNNVNVTGWKETDLEVDDETKTLIATHQSNVSKLEKEIAEKKKAAEEAAGNAAGIIIDDDKAEKSGPWRKSTFRPNRIGKNYLATDKDKGPYSITWKTKLPKPGTYEVRVSFGGGSGLANKAPYLIRHADGETDLLINQTVKPTIKGLWFPIGQFRFEESAEVTLTDKNAGGHVIADAIQFVHEDDFKQEDLPDSTSPIVELKNLEDKLKKLNQDQIKIPKAMAAKDLSNDRLGDLHIRIRGETKNLGKKIPRGYLQVATSPDWKLASISASESGRHQLAKWLTHPEHPLTARVMANRVWQHLFGQGIVTTSDNFGARGTLPTHPELLDYLAGKFIANDWSVKSLILQIVRSKTYQQSVMSTSNDDPGNARLHRQNRRPASAEAIRDSILAIAGKLDRAPRQSVVESLGMYAIATSGKRDESLSQTGKLRQRSIYMPLVRGAVPPSLAVFDMPNPDLVTGVRANTTVPAQALYLMNSPFVLEMAGEIGSQYAEEIRTHREVVQELYRRILIRDADDDDVAMGEDFIQQRINDDEKTRQEAIASFVQVLFSSTEFRFVE